MQQGTTQRAGLAVLVAFVLSFAVIYGLVKLASPQEEAPVGPVPAAQAPAVEVPVGFGTGVTPIGTVVTLDGRTLYRFDKDTPKPPESNCAGRCATTWPPVVAPGGKAPEIPGVDRSLVGTIERADGTVQVTLKGWPLYTYSGDTEPGEADGEGVTGVWHAVGADGKPAVSGTGARGAAQEPVQTNPTAADEQAPGAGY
jgi:predicted lipoprotein with Yx(FWY)xxD motif